MRQADNKNKYLVLFCPTFPHQSHRTKQGNITPKPALREVLAISAKYSLLLPNF